MTLNDWKDVLLLQEVEALEDFGYTMERYGDRELKKPQRNIAGDKEQTHLRRCGMSTRNFPG